MEKATITSEEILKLKGIIQELSDHREEFAKGLNPGDSIVGVKNGQGFFLKKSYAIAITAAAFVSLVIGIISLVGIFLQPVLWKADIEFQQKVQDARLAEHEASDAKQTLQIGTIEHNQIEDNTNLQNTMKKVHVPWQSITSYGEGNANIKGMENRVR